MYLYNNTIMKSKRGKPNENNFATFNDSNKQTNKNLKEKVFSRFFLILGEDGRKSGTDAYHKRLKIVDLITLSAVCISALLSISAIEENLYFVNVPDEFFRRKLLFSTNNPFESDSFSYCP